MVNEYLGPKNIAQSETLFWNIDGIQDDKSPNSYDFTFEYFLEDYFNVPNFQELINKKSKELKREVNVLDLFGGAYFIKDLKNISNIVGVRLDNIDKDLEKQYNNQRKTDYVKRLKYLMENKKRDILIGYLYKDRIWKTINEHIKNKNYNSFDLIVCRPEGPFRNAHDKNRSVEGLSNIKDNFKGEIYISLLNRTLKLLSEEGGTLFTQVPNLSIDNDTLENFWKEYIKEKEKEGYKFMLNGWDEGSFPKETFTVVRNKLK